ncbi:MAG TPA: hypothetical protein VHY84_15790 [Bryobacteraceae bacterium]|nr:hypothetical protein [Bryobacteraceae bacterium]
MKTRTLAVAWGITVLGITGACPAYWALSADPAGRQRTRSTGRMQDSAFRSRRSRRWRGHGPAPAAVAGLKDYAVTAIPGIIVAGQKWKEL